MVQLQRQDRTGLCSWTVLLKKRKHPKKPNQTLSQHCYESMGRCNCMHNRLRRCTTCLTDCSEQCEVHLKTRKQKMRMLSWHGTHSLYICPDMTIATKKWRFDASWALCYTKLNTSSLISNLSFNYVLSASAIHVWCFLIWKMFFVHIMKVRCSVDLEHFKNSLFHRKKKIDIGLEQD